MSWIVATGNAHKLREIGQVLEPLGVALISPREANVSLEVEEWGTTFAENAVIKAIAFAQAAGRVALADDSGLEVAHLQWGPGVHSARYAGEGATDADNNAKLISALRGVDPLGRRARYRCVIAIATPLPKDVSLTPMEALIGIGPNDTRNVAGFEVRTFDGAFHGRIEDDARGDAGFGYDPYFALPDGRHVAELSDDEKNAISHRGEALRKVAKYLKRAQ